MKMSYPTSVTFKHQATSSRLWALLTIIPVKMLLLIPHLIVMMFMGLLMYVVLLLGVFAVLFTGEYPKSFEKFLFGFLRWAWRINTYFYCMTDKYPPFTLEKGGSPADLDFTHQSKNSRLWALLTIVPVKMIILIPHFFVMWVYSIVAAFCQFVGMFAVLFMGRYPQSFENVIVGYMQYTTRIFAYVACMTDKYPPFDLKD